MPTTRLRSLALTLFASLALAAPAAAHPHVWVDAKAELVFDPSGDIVAVRNIWRFDDAYSAFASQGLDTNGDGKLSVDELKPLADINVDSLKDYAYFTFIMAGDKDIDFDKPTQYWVQQSGDRLLLFFTLPAKEPVKVKDLQTRLEIYDPTYFVAFRMIDDKDGPLTLDGAPKACSVKVFRPPEMDPSAAAALAQVPADQRELPASLQLLTEGQTNGADLTCP